MFGIKQIPSLFRMAATTEGSLGLTASWNLAGQLSLRRRAERDATAATDQCACGLALAGDGEVYNEEAFRYFLGIERERFAASSQPFVLLLVDMTRHLGQGDRMTAVIGDKVFTTLKRSLRDTDMIGWYRQGHVIGAVLPHVGDAPVVEVSRQMADRIRRALRTDLPKGIARHLKVRLYQPMAGTKR